MRKITGLTASVLACVLGTGCGGEQPKVLQFEQQLVTAQTVTLEPGGWVRTFKSFGVVTEASEYAIVPAVGGVVARVGFAQGQAVAPGDELLRLEDGHLRAELKAAELAARKARANLHDAVAWRQRNEGLYKNGNISRQQYEKGEAALSTAADALRRALTELQLAGAALQAAVLHSPVAGVVSARNVAAGQSLEPGVVVGVLQVARGLRVRALVSAGDARMLSPGDTVPVTFPAIPGQIFGGRIEGAAGAIDTATDSFTVGVLLEEPDPQIEAGMSALVQFSGAPEEGVVAIPRAALVERGRQLVVYRVVDNIARAVQPTLGLGGGDSVPVLDGLDVGDEIVVSNLRAVSDGQLIGRTGK